MVLESLINHFEFLPKYPCPFPDASLQNSFASIIYSLCMSLPSFTALKHILLCFLGAQIFQINILSLKSAARHLQQQPRGRPQCCLQKHSNVFSKFQLGLPFVHHPLSPHPRQQPESLLNLFSAVYT